MDIEQQCAAFEAWYEKEMGQPAYQPNGIYTKVADYCLSAWQAAIELDRQGRGELVLDALKGMQRFFGKWPEFVPAPEYIGDADEAVRRMNNALSAPQPAKSAAWGRAFDDARNVAHLYNSGSGMLEYMQMQYAHHLRADPTTRDSLPVAEPVKVPSDEEILTCIRTSFEEAGRESIMGENLIEVLGNSAWLIQARALLTRYGSKS